MSNIPINDLDAFLLAELKAGNQRAFEKIYTKYYCNLTRYSNYIIKDEDKARSLVQNVFLKLWESREQLKKVESLLPYLVSMVRNESLNYLKKEQRFTKVPNMAAADLPSRSSENTANQNELLEQLLIALNLMPERCRIAFELSRFENKTNKEIAGHLNISVKGVEALITRSLKHLRIHLSDFLPSEKNRKLPGNFLMILFSKF